MARELQNALETVGPAADRPSRHGAGRLGRTLSHCLQWAVALGFVACGFFGAEVVHLTVKQAPPVEQQHILAVTPAHE